MPPRELDWVESFPFEDYARISAERGEPVIVQIMQPVNFQSRELVAIAGIKCRIASILTFHEAAALLGLRFTGTPAHQFVELYAE